MTNLKIQASNDTLASGALIKEIPSSALPICLDNVQCQIEGDDTSSIQWVTASLLPSPPPQDNILNLVFTGDFGKAKEFYHVHVFFSGSTSTFMLSSNILTGDFTFQKSSMAHNASYYWSIVSSSVDYIHLRFDKKELVALENEPLVFSVNLNFS